MARKSSKLTVHISPKALRNLDEIWDWNVSQYGLKHASAYLAFIVKGIRTLSSQHSIGPQVPDRPTYRFIVLRNGKSKYSHIAVYEVTDQEVVVLNIYHSAQDWQSKIARESEE